MISISTQTYDLNGNIIINEDPDSTFENHEARVFRAKTLDDKVYISSPKFVDGDRTFIVLATLTEEEAKRLLHLKGQGFLDISCKDGFFSGIIKTLNINHGVLNMTIWIKERLDEV